MAMVLAVGMDMGHHSEWAGDGTLVGDHLGQLVSDGVGDPAGAGDLLGMEAIDLGVAGMAVATGDLVGMETVTGVVVTGVTQIHVTLQVDQFTETTITHVVHHQEAGLRGDTTVIALLEILEDMTVPA
jgi:hypothetical protein